MTSAPTETSTIWIPESVRFTTFFESTDPMSFGGTWKRIVGEEPESEIRQSKNQILREQGPFKGGKLIFSATPNRIDWILFPDEGTVSTGSEVTAMIGESVTTIRTLSLGWLESSPGAVRRIALGLASLRPVSDRISGYRLLAQYLRCLQIDPEGSRDLQYQINRPRASRVAPSLIINRLATWNVGMRAAFTLTPSETSVQTALAPGQHALRVELDVNTDPTAVGGWDQSTLAGLLDEFRDLALELLVKGDVP